MFLPDFDDLSGKRLSSVIAGGLCYAGLGCWSLGREVWLTPCLINPRRELIDDLIANPPECVELFMKMVGHRGLG